MVDSETQRNRRTSGKRKNLLLILIGSIIIGILYSLIGNILYNSAINVMWTPLLVGVYFACLAMCIFIFIFIVLGINGKIGDEKKSIVSLLIGILIVFVMSMALEFIYELGKNISISEATSYVLAVDNSGSMEGNDPDQKRIQAIRDLLKKKDVTFPYAVYSFNDQISKIREMAPANTGNAISEIDPDGGTLIYRTLEIIYSDLNKGTGQAGTSPRIILLTDGDSGDGSYSEFRELAQKYTDHGYTICTIGLGNANDTLLECIAKCTGGVYIRADEASDLTEAMEQASVKTSKRDLLSVRYVPTKSFWYGLMRVVFLLLIGVSIAAIKIFLSDEEDREKMFIVCAIGCPSVSVLMEIGLNLFGFSTIFMRLIMCVGFSIAVATVFVEEKVHPRREHRSIDEYVGKFNEDHHNELNPSEEEEHSQSFELM